MLSYYDVFFVELNVQLECVSEQERIITSMNEGVRTKAPVH